MKKAIRSKIPWILTTFFFAWATFTSILLYQKGPFPSKNILQQDSQQTARLEILEKIAFVRQFVDQYLTYTSSNYWQTQTALAFLMSKDLRSERLLEIERLKSRLEKSPLFQKSEIQLLEKLDVDVYSLHVLISTSRNGSTDKLNAQIQLHLVSTPRSIENPWGLQVSALQFQEMTAQKFEYPPAFLISDQDPLLLSFPCSVENFLVPKELPLQVKIVTMNISEVQLLLTQKIGAAAEVRAICGDSIFPIHLTPSQNTTTLFADLKESPRKKKSPSADPNPKRQKGPYEKTIEEQMGFVIEE